MFRLLANAGLTRLVLMRGACFTFFPPPVPNTGKSWTFLGELDKIVPVSPMRFQSIGMISTESKSCLQLNINLDAGETVRVGAVSPSGIYVEKSLTLKDVKRDDGTFSICDSS